MPIRFLLRGCARDLSSKSFEAPVDGCIEDSVSHAEDESADDVGVDLAGQLDGLAGSLLDASADRAHHFLVQLDGGRYLDGEQLLLLAPELVEVAADPERDRKPMA